jgi:hypothetical protein
VTVNVTAASPSGAGFLSVLPGPCGVVALPPFTSNLNVTIGHNVAASATVALGDDQLCVYSSTETDVIVDLQATHSSSGSLITAVDPRRIIYTPVTVSWQDNVADRARLRRGRRRQRHGRPLG